MKNVNKKIFVLLLSGIVLVSGCAKEENSDNEIIENNINQNDDIENSNEEDIEQNIEDDVVQDTNSIENEIVDYITNPDNALDSEKNKEKLNETKEKLIKKNDCIN